MTTENENIMFLHGCFFAEPFHVSHRTGRRSAPRESAVTKFQGSPLIRNILLRIRAPLPLIFWLDIRFCCVYLCEPDFSAEPMPAREIRDVRCDKKWGNSVIYSLDANCISFNVDGIVRNCFTCLNSRILCFVERLVHSIHVIPRIVQIYPILWIVFKRQKKQIASWYSIIENEFFPIRNEDRTVQIFTASYPGSTLL